jgi:hypothetical protein
MDNCPTCGAPVLAAASGPRGKRELGWRFDEATALRDAHGRFEIERNRLAAIVSKLRVACEGARTDLLALQFTDGANRLRRVLDETARSERL